MHALASAGAVDPVARCHVMLALGDSLWSTGELEGARRVYEEAGELAETLGLDTELARAALGFGSQDVSFDGGVVEPRLIRLLEKALARIGDTDGVLRASLMARLAAALDVPEEPVELLEGGAELRHRVHLRVDVAVRVEDVGIHVVVEVEDQHGPREVGEDDLLDPVPRRVVAVGQRDGRLPPLPLGLHGLRHVDVVRLEGEVRLVEVEPPVAVDVMGLRAHPGEVLARIADRDPEFERALAERPVAPVQEAE